MEQELQDLTEKIIKYAEIREGEKEPDRRILDAI